MNNFFISQNQSMAFLEITPSLTFIAQGESKILSLDCRRFQRWTLSGLPSGWSASSTSGKGPTQITITAPNNTSLSSIVKQITITSGSKIQTCNLTQAAGYYTYAIPVITITYSDISAGGGTVIPTYSFTQTYGWNGVSSGVGTIVDGGSWIFTNATNTSTGAVTANSLGTTEKVRSKITTVNAQVTSHGVTAVKPVDVFQEANTAEYATPVVSVSYATIPASGGTVTPNKSFTQGVTYTSGDSDIVSDGGTWSYSGTGVNTSTGAVTANSLGTTEKTSLTLITNAAASVNSHGLAGSSSTNVYQNVNNVASRIVTIKWTSNNAASRLLSPAGESDTVKFFVTETFDSGVTGAEFNPTSNCTISLSNSTGFTVSGLTVSVPNRGKTETPVYTTNVTGTYRGTQASSTIALIGGANTPSYGTPTGKILGVTDIPAGGGTVSQGAVVGTITQPITWASGTPDSVTNPTISESSYSDPVTAPSKGTVPSDRTVIGTLTYSYKCNGQWGTASATVYQQANSIKNYSLIYMVLTYNNDTPFAVSGETRSPNLDYEFYEYYTSDESKIITTGAPLTYSVTGTGFTINSTTGVLTASANTGSTTRTATATVKAEFSASDYWYANSEVTQAAKTITAYENVAINIYSYNDIPYTGGSVSYVSDVTYDIVYNDGSRVEDNHGLPPGYHTEFSMVDSNFSINTSTGVVSVGANTSSSSRSATAYMYVKNGSQHITYASTIVRQNGIPSNPTITLTCSYDAQNGSFTVFADAAVRDNISLTMTYYDVDGHGADVSGYSMNIGDTSISGLMGGPTYPYGGIFQVNNDDSGSVQAINAIYTWTPPTIRIS